MRAVKSEYLRDVIVQVFDVVTDTTHAKLTEVAEVFANLRGVQVKLLRQRLRRDSLDPGRVKRIEAAKINAQPAGCQF